MSDDAPVVGNGGVQSGWGAPQDVMAGVKSEPMIGSEFVVPQPKPSYEVPEQVRPEKVSEYKLYYRVLNAMVNNGIAASDAMGIAEATVWPEESDEQS